MMKRSMLLFFLLASPVQAQDLTIVGEGVKVIKVDKIVVVKVDQTLVTSFPFTVKAPLNAGLYFWTLPSGVDWDDQGDNIQVNSAPKGMLTIKVKLIKADFDKKVYVTSFAKITVAIGTSPIPPDPANVVVPALVGKSFADAAALVAEAKLVISPSTGTGSVLTQTPAAGTQVLAGGTVTVTLDSGPVPGPAPIPVAGLRVMMVYSKKDAAKLTTGQYAAIFGADMRNLLEAKCVVEPETSKKGYRIWETGISPAGDLKLWQDAFALAKSDPWLIVSNGKAGYSGPLPAKLEDSIALVNQYAVTGGGK